MFGENTIVVSKTISIDAKRRMGLPKETGAEVSEKLCFMHDLYRTKLVILGEKAFEEKLEHILAQLERIHYEEKRINAEEYRRMKRYICAVLCYSYEKVDHQRRILIPSKAAERLQFDKKVFVVGNETRLDVYRDEETFHSLNRQNTL